MSNLSYIDTKKSIELGRLILKKDSLDYLGKAIFLMVAAGFIINGIVLEIEIPYEGEFTGFLLFILAPLFIILGTYSMYRKIREDDIICVKTNLSKKQNQQIIKDFLKKYHYTINEENSEIIIVIDEHMLSYNGLWRKKYVYIIEDFAIYFNIQKLYPKISPPVLVSHLLLKRDLRKFLLES